MNPPPAETIRWRRIAVPAYGPTILVSIGSGAIMPLVALSARDLGASVGVAALIVALIGIGQLVGDLPAGALAARIGERRALIAACLLDTVALLGAFFARSLILLAIAVFVAGLAGAVFSLARQAYLTELVPVSQRARALSTLGGTNRIGSFIGPFVAALLVTQLSLAAAYGFAALMSLAAAVLIFLLPDLNTRARPPATERRSVSSVLAEHRFTLATLGTGVLVIAAARSTRQSIIPLWAESVGVDAATTSLIFGLSAGIDMLLFYPGGAIMDRFGRVWVAVPSMIILGAGFILLPFTHDAVTVGLVAMLMGFGNGISSGIVMTLGADAAPPDARVQFLGGWRLFADLGHAGGPAMITLTTVFGPLAAASFGLAGLTLAGSAWVARWVPRFGPSRSGPPSAAPPPEASRTDRRGSG